ncbi:amidohydrolase family protein [Pedobacter rhodius]|uniref:Amidohydrolase family protein n=1 Tax=Pedobacter rhodius TaxID=3004098 RepID=A0ABT4KUE4_9SPHI|nr:amidohydrolase family protein [Pedobacter sp. SJ11]MCZ4222537.1 amidohydrolase family protein [Pedobacter sp. SJ11]
MNKKYFAYLIFTVLIFCTAVSYGQSKTYDLAIKNVTVFDSKTKKLHKHQTVLINTDIIAAVVDNSFIFNAVSIINGNNRLIVPGFIDTHTHLKNVYGKISDDEKLPVSLDRKKLSDTYLSYGTTTIIDMGQPERWIATSLNWQQNTLPAYPGIYISGGAMVSAEEGRKTYMNHVVVKNPEDARLKVISYAESGIKHIKIYWRLRAPEMKAVILEGNKQHLTISAHIDNNVTSISDAIDLGVKNIEHMLSIPPEILNTKETFRLIQTKYGIGDDDNVDKFLARILLFYGYIKEHPELNGKLENLFDKMAKNEVSLSTAIHFLGSLAGKTYFNTSLSDQDVPDLSSYTPGQKQLLAKSFGVMMQYLKDAHDKGVKIRIGTDCKDGGKALLSELLLLHEADFSIGDILQIATLNGAQAMRIEDSYGTIAPGKKADLLIFSKSPYDNYRNFLAEKIIVKAGKVYQVN